MRPSKFDRMATVAVVAIVGVLVSAPGADAKKKRHFCKACIDTESIKPDAVTTLNIADGAVTKSKLGPGTVGQDTIVASGVGTDAIAEGAITASKISPGAVGTEAIADGAVTATKLAPPQWQEIDTFFNGWTTYDDSDLNYPKLRYYIDSDAVIHLRGFIQPGFSPLAFSVPNALAPDKQVLEVIATDNGPTTFSMGTRNGSVSIQFVSGATKYSFDGVSWPIGR